MIKTSKLYLKALQQLVGGDELSYELFTIYCKFSYPFRKTFRFVKRLTKWVPLLWNNEDWDYAYLLEVMEMKLSELERNQREDSNHVGNERRAKEIRATIERIKRFNDDERALTEEERAIIDEYCGTLDFRKTENKTTRMKTSYKFTFKYPFVKEVREEVDYSTYSFDSLANEELEKKYQVIRDKQLKNEEKNWRRIFLNIALKGRGWWS